MALTPFHLAIQVRDIDEARDFYGAKMGFPEGRSSEDWIDWNMFGHQMVTHCNKSLKTLKRSYLRLKLRKTLKKVGGVFFRLL